MNTDSGKCRVSLISMTQALKAQKILASEAIPCEIVKVGVTSRRGCSYGIEFNCNQKNNVKTVLSRAGISPEKWNTAD